MTYNQQLKLLYKYCENVKFNYIPRKKVKRQRWIWQTTKIDHSRKCYVGYFQKHPYRHKSLMNLIEQTKLHQMDKI